MERSWRAVAESLGLGLEAGGGGEEEREEGEELETGRRAAVAVAATIDRRALRSGLPALPAPPSSTWRSRVRAAWPELCFECRLPDSGRRRSKSEAQKKDSSSLSSAPRTLSIRHCHSCSSAFSSAKGCQGETRLVDAPTALRILRSGGESDDGDGEDEHEGQKNKNDDELLLLAMSRLPRALDVRPKDPRFRTVELFRRRDVRALARGFERDIYF